MPGSSATLLWHGDRELHGVEAVVVPGGFSYGDYLRVGAIARFSPVMESVITATLAQLQAAHGALAALFSLTPSVRSEDGERHAGLDARREPHDRVARHAHAAVGCGSPHLAADVLDAVLRAVRRA